MTQPDPTTVPVPAPADQAPATPPATPPAEPAKTDPPKVEPKATDSKTFTQDEVNALLAKTRDEARARTEKTAEERIAELEKSISAAEERALNAALLAEASDFQNPASVLRFVEREGLSSDDPAAVKAAVDAIRTSDPYLVKTETPAPPAPRSTPGVAAPATGRLLSAAELESIPVEDLAKDPAKMALYLQSVDALKKG